MLKTTTLTKPILMMGCLVANLLPAQSLHSLAATSNCQVPAYVADSDRQGLNIRAMPSSRSKILGTLPRNTEVTILKITGDWSLVTPIDPASQKVTFRGQGWVSSNLLATGTKGSRSEAVPLYQKPSSRSRIVGKLPADVAVKIVGCTNTWALVRKQRRLILQSRGANCLVFSDLCYTQTSCGRGIEASWCFLCSN
jgi:SH3-like domain-containing protein